MTRWAVLDATLPGAPVVAVCRSRHYARYLSAWLQGTVVVPWRC